MAAKNKRVFEIARDLGVQSKDIIAKCEAEGIPGINNHMSSVSVGLAATIGEWFSDSGGGVATAVETAAPVDVERAKAKAKRKPAKKATPLENGDTVEEAPAPAEPPVIPTLAEKKTPETTVISTIGAAEKKAVAKKPPAEPQEPRIAAEAPAEQPVARPAAAGEERKAPEVVMNVPDRPKEVKPVGPMLQEPRKTQLSGPKVIRVEAPDVLPAPRPRREQRDQPGVGSGGARAGRGAAYGFVDDEAAGRARSSRRNKRRGATPDRDGRRARGQREGDDSSSNWRKQDLLEREERLNRSGGFFRTHRRDAIKKQHGRRAAAPARGGGPVAVEEPITIKELSAAAGIKAADILRKLLLAGTPTTINATLETDRAVELMLEFGIELEVHEQKTAEQVISQSFSDREVQDEQLRSPVVTILGHVDHGKTSLLDRIRQTNVASGEAGGITQATSAFRVPVKAGDAERTIVFLDTPGHEAFTEMRARGARVTDLVVLVVAADDGVMPQTVESINHAKAAGVPLIVALNKIDKPEATDANIQRILGQLAEHDLNPVEWGGSTEVVRTSAISGDGVQDLLDHIDFAAQLHEWKADFEGPAEGSVIEAQLEEGRGPVARILVQQGMLRRGDFIVIGRGFGRVRDIVNDRGERIDEAGPSTPVAISGIDELPDAGDRFFVAESLRGAEAAATERRSREREKGLAQPKVTLDNIFEKLQESGRKELNLIVKADVQGSVETLRKTLGELSLDEVRVTVLHAAVGGINETDITLAHASGAIVIGFNVTASNKARQFAEQKGVDIRLYEVIYDITGDVEKAAKGMLEPEHRLEVLGHAEVRQVFKVSKVGMVAGCYVTDGVIERNSQIRVTRDGIVVESDRRLEQLKRFKDDAREVRAGQECGMKIEGYNDIKEGDVLECYKTIEVRAE